MWPSIVNIFWRLALIITLLIIGLCIYILFRQNVLFIEFLFGVKDGVFCHADLISPLPYFIVYCLPDGLWYLALLLTNDLIGNLLHSQNDRFSLIIDTLTMSAPFLMEIGQATGYLTGTFDICDIMTYLFTLITYTLWIRKKSVVECK